MSDSVDETLYAFRRNLFVAASAGTGKTHRLTSLYALLTLGLTSMGETDPRRFAAPILPTRIVATTFSRAAATEIQERVEHLLVDFARGEPPPSFAEIIAARLANANERPNDETLRRRATLALDALPRARIDTVHGVAHSLVRTYALDIGVPPNARIEDEDEAREIAGAAIDAAMASALEGAPETKEAARALLRAAGGLEWLREACRTLFDRMDEDGLETGAITVPNHEERVAEEVAELRRVARGCAEGSSSRDLASASRDFLTMWGGASVPAMTPDTERVLETLFSVRKPTASKATSADHEFEAYKRRHRGSSNRERSDRFIKLCAMAPILGGRERAILSIVSNARESVAAERTRRGVLSFGDLLRLARRLMMTNAAVSAEVRSEVDALFVDEFQDTSLVQRDLVYLMRESEESARNRPSGALPSAEGLAPSGLFLVGDRKQSIYAFRGADVSVFSRVAVELAGEPATVGLDLPRSSATKAAAAARADFLSLTESRRSGKEIVAFVNEVSKDDFSRGLDGPPRDFEMVLGPAEALVALDAAPESRVLFVRNRNEEVRVSGEPEPQAPPSVRDGIAGPFREARNAALAAQHARSLGFLARDIAVLARRRGAIPLLEQALDDLGLPFVVAGRALYETREVRDVAALLRLVSDPSDRHAIATVARGPVIGLSDAALLDLAGAQGIPENMLLRDGPRLARRDLNEESARLRAFRTRFQASRAALARMSPGEATREIVRLFDLDRLVAAMPRARARLGNLDRLAEIASKRGGSLFSFSRWLDRQIADETDEAEAVVFSPEDDAIRLTTIHGSKGLDFEAVVLVDLNSAPAPRFPPLGYWKQKEGRSAELVVRHRGSFGTLIPTRALEETTREARARENAERRRLSYVAVTRAKRFLALVEPLDPPRNDSLYATLLALRESSKLTSLTDVVAADLEASLSPAPAAPAPIPSATTAPRLRTTKRLAMATTPLSVFRGCERRFELRFLLGLEEPVATGQLELFDDSAPVRDERSGPDGGAVEGKDPRALGRAAHRVLETWPQERWGLATRPDDVGETLLSEGIAAAEAERLAPHLARVLSSAWARGVGAAPRVLRETELACTVPGDVSLSLRGTADLLVEHGDGRIDVIDYKVRRPRASIVSYAFQLRSYALSVAKRATSVRAGILFLEGATEPVWLDEKPLAPSEHEEFAKELSGIASRFAEARASGRFAPIEVDACRALACGFITACHRGA